MSSKTNIPLYSTVTVEAKVARVWRGYGKSHVLRSVDGGGGVLKQLASSLWYNKCIVPIVLCHLLWLIQVTCGMQWGKGKGGGAERDISFLYPILSMLGVYIIAYEHPWSVIAFVVGAHHLIYAVYTTWQAGICAGAREVHTSNDDQHCPCSRLATWRLLCLTGSLDACSCSVHSAANTGRYFTCRFPLRRPNPTLKYNPKNVKTEISGIGVKMGNGTFAKENNVTIAHARCGSISELSYKTLRVLRTNSIKESAKPYQV